MSVDREVADFAAGLSEAHLACRDYGHSWTPATARWDSELRAFARTLRCVRCHTERAQWLSQYGHPLRGHYVYPEGYQALGLGRLDGESRDVLRLESVSRLLGDELAPKRRRRRAG